MKHDPQNSLETAATTAADGSWLELVRRQVGSLRYGVVQVVVQDGRVVQIEKTERVRLEKSATERI
jgi:hypothetical protein